MTNILVIGGGPVCLRALSIISNSSEFILTGYIPASRILSFNQDCIQFAQQTEINIMDINYLPADNVDLILSIGNSIIFDEHTCNATKILNFHAAPLPKYKGSACPSFAILNGEQDFGFCFHLVSPGLDAGPIVLQKAFPILDNMTAFDVDARSIACGLDYLETALKLSSNPQFTPSPQSQLSVQSFKPYKRSSLEKYRYIPFDQLDDSYSLVKIRALTWPQVLDPCFTYIDSQKILLTFPIASPL